MISFLKRLAATVATPSAGKVTLFVDSATGEPSYKDDTGTVTTMRGVAPSVAALSIAAGAVTINLGNGANRNFTLALTENVTSIAFTNPPAAGYVAEIEVLMTQDGTGGRTVALPGSFKALGGSDTLVAAAANAVTLLSAKTFNQGTAWRYAMQESA